MTSLLRCFYYACTIQGYKEFVTFQRTYFRPKLFRGGPRKIDDFETRWIVVTPPDTSVPRE